MKKIINYKSSHIQPIELRNVAIVLIGLRMVFRASDVVNLELYDINWKNKQIMIIQQKTQVQLRLPMPVEVGNTIYSHLKNGQPKSSDKHVFIRHNAPYGKLTSKNFTLALHSILPERKAGSGFHVTRRTFATRLLNNGSSIEFVALLAAPPNTKIGLRDRTIMILLYDSAIRVSELLELKVHSLNARTTIPYIRVHGKGDKELIVALTDKTVDHLNAYMKKVSF